MKSYLLHILVELHPLHSARNQEVLVDHWDQEKEEQKEAPRKGRLAKHQQVD